MGGKIVVIFFLVVVVGLGIYLFRSGVVGNVANQLSGALNGSSSFALKIAPGTPLPPPTITTSTISAQPSTATPINPADIPNGFTASQLSPYFQQVRFGGMYAGSYGSYGEITLYAANIAPSSTIDVTGWHIQSNRGGEYIPQAIDLYDPSGLTPPGDILLASGQYVYLYSSSGPFNLRLNECIGYIGNEEHLTPPLPQDCPYPDRSAISTFTGTCQNFVDSIGSCQTPDLNNPEIPQNDYACREYIANNFNYEACFEAHEGDADFLSNQWWVWMGSSPIDPYHDNVYLFDRNGLLVDSYSY